MLLGALSVLNKLPGRTFGGSTVSDGRANFNKSGANRNKYFSDRGAGFSALAAVPNGYVPPYSWIIAPKSGGMASYTLISGTGAPVLTMAGGKAAVAALTGTGTITDAQGALVVSAVATLTGTGGFSSSPELIGILDAVASLAGSGNLAGAATAFGALVAAVTGTGTLASEASAIGELTADLTPFTELSPESLAAAILDAANGIEQGLTPREALRLIAAATAGKVSGGGTTTVTFRSAEADDRNRIVATVDSSGNRTGIVTDLSD